MSVSALDVQVDRLKGRGWRVEQRGEGWALMQKGEKIPHGRHILMTVITLGIWGIIYGLHLIFGGQKTVRLEETRKGRVRQRRLL